jgi:biopolymer transport protein ExbD
MELKKAPDPVSEINVTPMVDVMLVVLIIFMVITPLLSKTIPLDMAKARNFVPMGDADKEDAIIVAITRDGQVFLSPGLKKTTAEDLGPAVRDLLKDKPSKLVYIKAGQPAHSWGGPGRPADRPAVGQYPPARSCAACARWRHVRRSRRPRWRRKKSLREIR